jgi:hypothetical protein
MDTAKTIRKPSVFEHKNRGDGKSMDWDVEGSTRDVVEKRHTTPIVTGTLAHLPFSHSHEFEKTNAIFTLARTRALYPRVTVVSGLPVFENFPLRIR